MNKARKPSFFSNLAEIFHLRPGMPNYQSDEPDPYAEFEVLLQGEVKGPLSASKMRHLGGFMLSTMVRPVGGTEWKPAYEMINLKVYFSSSKPHQPASAATRNALLSALSSPPFKRS